MSMDPRIAARRPGPPREETVPAVAGRDAGCAGLLRTPVIFALYLSHP